MPNDGELVLAPNGEVMTSASVEEVNELLTPIALLKYEPVSPEQLEELIMLISERIEKGVVVIMHLYEEMHRKEEDLEHQRAITMLASPNQQATFARAWSIQESKHQLHDFNVAKEKWHYAQWLHDALQSRLYGMLNVNKSLTASMVGQRSAR